MRAFADPHTYMRVDSDIRIQLQVLFLRWGQVTHYCLSWLDSSPGMTRRSSLYSPRVTVSAD